MIELFHQDFGGRGNPPLVVLHGLLGSSRNWAAAGRDLSQSFHVLALDLRNHGKSPHVDAHDYDAMSRDVVGWLDKAGLEKVYLMGHSMGGKTAMRLACAHPERVEALVIVDITSRARPPKHASEVHALAALPLDRIASRGDADRLLSETVPSTLMRQFLLTNLVRREDNTWGWQANVDGLARHLPETGLSPIDEEARYPGPALWIIGGKSDFVQPEDHALIEAHFPHARIEIFEGSGHNPHAEERGRFVEVVGDFLKNEGERIRR